MIIRIVIFMLFLLEVLNITTYAFYRLKGKGRATLIVRNGAERGEKMTYCLPSIQADPKESFRFIEHLSLKEPDLVPGGITYIKYNDYGFDPEQISKQIIRDIERFEYEPYIISIGIGDQIARFIEQNVKNVRIITINPATNADSIKVENVLMLQMKRVFMNTFMAFGGWLGNAKAIYINNSSHRQSVSLYLDCLNCLVKSELEVTTDATVGLVISRYDHLLDNCEVILNFCYLTKDQIALVDTGHANTVTGSVLYAEKIEHLLKNFYPPKEEDA